MNEDEQVIWGQPVSFQDFVQGFQVTPNQRRVELVPKADPQKFYVREKVAPPSQNQGEIRDANKERVNRSLSNYASNNFLLSTSNIRPDQNGRYNPGLGQFAGDQTTLTLSMGFDPFNASNYYKVATQIPKFRNWGLTRLLANELNNEVRVAGELGRNIGKSTVSPIIRTKIGDVEINNPGLYYHQSGLGKAKNFFNTNRMRTPQEEYWLKQEHVPLELRTGIIPGFPQNPGRAMFSQGKLWYGLNPEQFPDLLVTAKEMPVANSKAGIVRGSLQKLESQGTRRVTSDNIGDIGPHTNQNTSAYTYIPGYGYRQIQQEPKTSLRFFGKPSYERVNYSKYSVDATNPQEREILFKHWTSRYPNSGLRLLDNPQKISIGWDGENYLKVGEMPLSDRGKAIVDVMGNRMLKYPFREGIDPQWVVTPGRTSNKGISGFMDQLKNENTVMYMPLVQDSNIEGLSFASQPYLKINPWRNKPYQFTQIHEGLSHPTDPVVSELRTSSGNKILGNVFKDSQGATHVEGSYGKVTWPEDLYDKELLEKLISKDSRKPTEGRAVNWEMITDLYAQLAKKKGISFEEATKLPEIEFNNFVESTLDSPEKLTSFMKKFDNKYLSDYANVIEAGDSKQQAAYGNRILRMIKKAPSYILPIIGGDVIYQSNK